MSALWRLGYDAYGRAVYSYPGTWNPEDAA